MASKVELDDADLANLKAAVLVRLRTRLVNNVDPRKYMTFLRSTFVLDEGECGEMKSLPSRPAAAEAFVDILIRKGPQGYDAFCRALFEDRTQVYLLKEMTTTLELMKAKLKEYKAKQAELALEEQARLQQLQLRLQSVALHNPHLVSNVTAIPEQLPDRRGVAVESTGNHCYGSYGEQAVYYRSNLPEPCSQPTSHQAHPHCLPPSQPHALSLPQFDHSSKTTLMAVKPTSITNSLLNPTSYCLPVASSDDLPSGELGQ